MAAGPINARAGRISSPHGLDGSVKVAEALPGLLKKGGLVLVDGEERTIERVSGTPAKPIIRLRGSSRREDADELRGSIIEVALESVPELGEDEWWAAELIGCTVFDGDFEVGVVVDLIGLPSCEVLAVDRAVGNQLLVPMVGDALRSVDVPAKRIDVDLKFLGEAPE